MHGDLDRWLGRLFRAIWAGLMAAIQVALFLVILGGLFWGFVYWTTLVVKAAWGG